MLTALLAVALLAVGAGGVKAATLLAHATRQQTSADLAALTCHALSTQDYGLLTAQVDPAPQPPRATGTFNAAKTSATLSAEDKSEGRVSHCTYEQVSFVANSSHGKVANFALTIKRTKSSAITGALLIVQQHTDGSWHIGRASSLLPQG